VRSVLPARAMTCQRPEHPADQVDRFHWPPSAPSCASRSRPQPRRRRSPAHPRRRARREPSSLGGAGCRGGARRHGVWRRAQHAEATTRIWRQGRRMSAGRFGGSAVPGDRRIVRSRLRAEDQVPSRRPMKGCASSRRAAITLTATVSAHHRKS
jgi:hypothetical protein